MKRLVTKLLMTCGVLAALLAAWMAYGLVRELGGPAVAGDVSVSWQRSGKACLIEGKVVDATGTACAGERVYFLTASGTTSTTTDANGYFAEAPGEYWLDRLGIRGERVHWPTMGLPLHNGVRFLITMRQQERRTGKQ